MNQGRSPEVVGGPVAGAARVREQLWPQLESACDLLEHYHADHSTDMVTRFAGANVDIYVVSDPEWKAKFREFSAPLFTERCGR